MIVPGRLFPVLVMVFLVSFYLAPGDAGVFPCILLTVSGLAAGILGSRRLGAAMLVAAAISAGAWMSTLRDITAGTGFDDASGGRTGIWDCAVQATTVKGALLLSDGARFWAGSRSLASRVNRGDSVTVLGNASGGFIEVSLFTPIPSASLPDRARMALCGIWDSRIASRETRAIVSTLTAGERGDLPYSVRELFEGTGTTHLLAVSGLHVGLVAGAFMLLTARLRSGRWTSLFISMGAVCAYVLLTGARASTLRAAVMALMVLLALRIGGRSPDLLWIWSWAVVILCIFSGGTVLEDVGAQMSFGAVLSLILIGKRFEGRLSWARSVLFAGLVVSVGIAPLVSSVYGGMSPAAPVATLVSLPFMMTLMCLGPLALLPVPAGTAFGIVAEWVTFAWLGALGYLGLPRLEVSGRGTLVWGGVVLLLWVLSRRSGFLRRFA